MGLETATFRNYLSHGVLKYQKNKGIYWPHIFWIRHPTTYLVGCLIQKRLVSFGASLIYWWCCERREKSIDLAAATCCMSDLVKSHSSNFKDQILILGKVF